MNENKYILNQTNSFCSGCLSSYRNLISIKDLNKYRNVFIDITKITLNMYQNVFLCWECVAILKKITLFKYRIQKAQSILMSGMITPPKSLSRLSISNSEEMIIINHDDCDNDNKPIFNMIKQEIVTSDDNLDYDVENVYTELDKNYKKEIKKEKPETKKICKKSKASHYKIVYGHVYKKSLLRNKFPIKQEEVLLWLENEKNSDYYKSLKFKCKLCYHGFKCKEKLFEHNLEFHDKSLGEFVCKICQARFATESVLNMHVRTHAYAYKCTLCGYQCYSERRVNAHINTHKEFQCVYCDLKLPDLNTFHDHYKAMHSVFLCDHCGKSCKTKHMLQRHISLHNTTYPCTTCSRIYKSRSSLHKHIATKHTDTTPEEAYCVHCDKQFDSVVVYRRHVMYTTAHAHENDKVINKKVSCPECPNTYSRRAYMMNHYRHVHTKESKYYCTHCQRHFLNRTRYVEHMRFNHEGVKREKNKLCTICGRGFATNRILLNHSRTHSGERPYECEHCAARFTQKHSMLTHIQYIHHNNKRTRAIK